jgi:xanthine dehydrogenase molybdopterin-binding subunit B
MFNLSFILARLLSNVHMGTADIFFLEGETASITTDSNGQATWTHSTSLPSGTHTLAVTFYHPWWDSVPALFVACNLNLTIP